jgi:hypothetical protein
MARYPDESAGEPFMRNNAAVMCAEEKFSKIKKITPVKKPAGFR